MNILRKNAKLFVGIIIGVILVSGISIGATVTYLYNASEIKYNDEKSVAEALNELYTQSKESNLQILSYKGNNANGTTITVDIGSIIVVSAPGNSNATNAERVIEYLQGGSKNGIGTWTTVFRATDTSVKITPDNNNQFSYIVMK